MVRRDNHRNVCFSVYDDMMQIAIHPISSQGIRECLNLSKNLFDNLLEFITETKLTNCRIVFPDKPDTKNANNCLAILSHAKALSDEIKRFTSILIAKL